MQSFDLTLTEVRVATMVDGRYNVVEDAAVGILDGHIAWVGMQAELTEYESVESRSMHGHWITPALIDCHTHLVFAGNRAEEFERRLHGVSYEDIAREGGGITATVNATRTAGHDELVSQARKRLLQLRNEGCATVEIKSGYGLNLETEIRMLEVARALELDSGMNIVTTFLGAHTVPVEFADDTDGYIKLVCDEILPAADEMGLVDAVDAYCESIAFSTNQVASVFEHAKALGLPVKLHADQLSNSGGAELAAGFGAISADHLEYTNPSGVRAMADAGTVAVMLPGAFLTLRETQLPPIDEMRAAKVPIAVATDCNPGTSPVCSIRTSMTLATHLFKLTPEESLAGVTVYAARALGLYDRGTIEVGKRADIAVWDVGHPRELSYWIGTNEMTELYVNGRHLP